MIIGHIYEKQWDRKEWLDLHYSELEHRHSVKSYLVGPIHMDIMVLVTWLKKGQLSMIGIVLILAYGAFSTIKCYV